MYTTIFLFGCAPKDSIESNIETEEIINITNDNWENYFEFDTEEQLNKNNAGFIESVQYIQSVKLKDSFKNKIRTDVESKVYFSFIQPIDMNTYEIIDSKTGVWKLTGDLIHLKMNGANDRSNTRWSSFDENFCSVTEFQTFTMYGKLSLEVPGKINMETVKGTLYFKK